MEGYVNVNFFWGGEIIRKDGVITYSIDPKKMEYIKYGTTFEDLKGLVCGLMQISRHHWDVKLSFKYPQIGRSNLVEYFYLGNITCDADVTRMLSIPRTMQMGYGDVSMYIEAEKIMVNDPYSYQQDWASQQGTTQFSQYGTDLWSNNFLSGAGGTQSYEGHGASGSQTFQGFGGGGSNSFQDFGAGGSQAFQAYGGGGSHSLQDFGAGGSQTFEGHVAGGTEALQSYGAGGSRSFEEREFSPVRNVTNANAGMRLALLQDDSEFNVVCHQDARLEEQDGERSPRTDDGGGEFNNEGDSSEEEGGEDVQRALVPVNQHHVPLVPWFESEKYTPVAMSNPNEYLAMYEHGQKLSVGKTFVDKNTLQHAIREVHIAADRTYHVERSNTSQLIVKCPKEGCFWRLRAAKKASSGLWEITVNANQHNCLVQMPLQDHQKLSSKIISQIVKPYVIDTPEIPIASVITMVNAAFHHQVNYNKAWRGKQLAIGEVYGTWENTYEALPMFLTAMLKANPGSVAEIDAVPLDVGIKTSMCRRIFWCLKAISDGWQHARPILSIDGTFLKGKYNAKLLVAMGVDSNNHQFPVCYALVDEETYENWNWFLSLLRKHVCRTRMGVCIISDRAQGILAAMKDPSSGFCEPLGYHKYCLLHVRSNFLKKYSVNELKRLMYCAGSTTQIRKYDAYMKEIGEISPNALAWLKKLDPAKWTLAHDTEGRRYGIATTNMVEGFNGSIRKARFLPVTAMMEYLFYKTVKMVNTHRNNVEDNMQKGVDLCTETIKMLAKIQKRASGHSVSTYHRGRGMFSVKTQLRPSGDGGFRGHNIQNVNIFEKTCTCGKWATYQLPCSHVVAGCLKNHIDWTQWIGPYHYNTQLQKMFAPIINPLEPIQYWNYSLRVDWQRFGRLVPDETMRKLKKKRGDKGLSVRIRTEMDIAITGKKCSACKGEGHTKRSKKCPLRT